MNTKTRTLLVMCALIGAVSMTTDGLNPSSRPAATKPHEAASVSPDPVPASQSRTGLTSATPFAATVPSTYAVRRAGSGFAALNQDQHLDVTYDERGAEIRYDAKNGVTLRTTSVRCGDQDTFVQLGAFHEDPYSKHVVARDGYVAATAIEEWFANTNKGIEQGWTIDRAPCPGTDELSIEVATDGIVEERAGKITLREQGGLLAFSYGHARASDSVGQELPVQLTATSSNTIRIDVRGHDIAWPVVVDPLIASWNAIQVYGGEGPYDVGAGAAFLDHRTQYIYNPRGNRNADGFEFGWSGTVHRDVTITGGLAVAAPHIVLGSTDPEGQRAVLVRSGSTDTYLPYTDPNPNYPFGPIVPIAAFGETIAIYGQVYRLRDNEWTDDGVLPSDQSVALGDNIAATGPRAGGNVIASMSAHCGNASLFHREQNRWVLDREVSTRCANLPDIQPRTEVAADGTRVIVGFPSGNGYLECAGELLCWNGDVHILSYDGSTWTEESVAPPADLVTGQRFGSSLAFRRNVAIVDGRYVLLRFVNDDDPTDVVWREAIKLTADVGALHVGAAGTVAASTSLVVDFAGTAGSVCTGAAGCAAGYSCVDGNCCTSACAGPCAACSIATGGTLDGECTPVAAGTQPSTTCGGLLCDGDSMRCPVGCSSDAECGDGRFCSSEGVCSLSRSLGAVCDAVSECADSDSCRICRTGFCNDGYCCDSACNAPCDTCSAAEGTAANGTCSARRDGSFGDPACEGDLLCDGRTSGCPAACASDGDCIPGRYCDPTGQCAEKLPQRFACASDNNCAQGLHCVDGFCCNTVCDKTCEACDVPGHEGTCIPVPQGEPPRGNRPPCNGTGRCAGACDGDHRDGCDYPDDTVACGNPTCERSARLTQHCSGNGACVEDEFSTQCAPYTCNASGTACNGACTTNADCASGAFCNTTSRECAAGQTTCNGDTDLLGPNGETIQSCAPYKCDISGTCRELCTFDADCADSYVCVHRDCVNEDLASTRPSSAGCSCRVTGEGSADPSIFAGFAALLGSALLSRRRRFAKVRDRSLPRA